MTILGFAALAEVGADVESRGSEGLSPLEYSIRRARAALEAVADCDDADCGTASGAAFLADGICDDGHGCISPVLTVRLLAVILRVRHSPFKR